MGGGFFFFFFFYETAPNIHFNGLFRVFGVMNDILLLKKINFRQNKTIKALRLHLQPCFPDVRGLLANEFAIHHSHNWRIHGDECVSITIPLH